MTVCYKAQPGEKRNRREIPLADAEIPAPDKASETFCFTATGITSLFEKIIRDSSLYV
jgi:hypothetical protein